MSNNVTEKDVSLEEIEESVDLGEGLDLDISIGQEEDVESEETPQAGKPTKPEAQKPTTPEQDYGHGGCHHLKSMKINCDLEVGVGTKNKVIYVCPGKIQYFTARALCCSGDETIEIEFIGHQHCEHGKIKGHLGYYKIVNSGIIFIPNRNLSEFPERWFPTDILTFEAESACDKDIKFDVVFTYSRCVDCECGCNKSCKCE